MHQNGQGLADLKCAMYARVSKADETQNPENQVLRLREYAQAQGWEVSDDHVYVDRASGTDANRPELRRMLRAAAARRFGLVLTVKIDRIARSSLHLHQVVSELEARGIRFECSDQPISTNTPSGRLLMGILGEIAQFERSLIQERTRAGLARARAQGKQLGRPRAKIDLERVEALRSSGMGIRAIAREVGVSHQTLRTALATQPSKKRGG